MGIILEIRNGPLAGKTIGLKSGESLTVGRAAGRAQFAVPQDTFMSGVHFAVECGTQGCRVTDRKSANGTFLNGRKLREQERTLLANGDEIKAGQTVFYVKIVADEKLASMAPPEAMPARAQPSAPKAAEPPPPSPPRVPERQAPEQVSERVPPRGGAEPAHPPAEEPPPRADKRRAEEPSRPRQQDPIERPKRAPFEEPPRFHSIPSPERAIPEPPRAVEPAARAPVAAEQKPRDVGGQLPDRGARQRDFAFRVLGWSFPAAPPDWQVQEGFGLQRMRNGEFPSSVAATEEPLGEFTLPQYVESQISVLRVYLRDPKIEPAMPPEVGGADETMAVDVRHTTKDGKELVYRRIYARSGASVGVLTVTALAAEFPEVLKSLQSLLDSATFRATGSI